MCIRDSNKGPREFLTGNFTWRTYLRTHSYTDYNKKVVEWTSATLTFDIPESKNSHVVNKDEYNEMCIRDRFVCANRREMDMAYHVKFDMLCKLLPLYNPTWMTDFINDDKTWFNFDLNYEELMQLMDMGYLKEIAPSRIAHVLPWITRIRNKNPKGDDTFNSELLLKRDITLKAVSYTHLS